MRQLGRVIITLALAAGSLWARPADAADPPDTTRARPDPSEPPFEDQLEDYHFDPGEDCPYCNVSLPYPSRERGLHWHHHWDRVGLREYVVVPTLAGAAIAIHLFWDQPGSGNDPKPILFDEPVRDALRFDTEYGRTTARRLSDVLLVGSIVHVGVVDNFLVALVARQRPDVAWQMFMINTQAYALTEVVNGTVKRLVRRARPWDDQCAGGTDEFPCNDANRYRSFYSGHAAITATGAGLICAHHTQLELYKEPWLDTGACVLAIGMTAVTGTLRLSSDRHWSTDVITGHLMGYMSGYLLPTLLYYHEFRITPEPHDIHSEPTLAVLPVLSEQGIGVAGTGTF